MFFQKFAQYFLKKKGIDYGRMRKNIAEIARRFSSIMDNGKKILDTAENFFDEVLYKSPGIVGVYSTIRTAGSTYGTEMKKDYHSLRDDIGRIKDILFFRQPNHEINHNTYPASKLETSLGYGLGIRAEKDENILPNAEDTLNAEDALNPGNALNREETRNISEERRRKEYLNTIIGLKNKYRNNIDTITHKFLEAKHEDSEAYSNFAQGKTIDSIIREAMYLKVNNLFYADIAQIRYNHILADEEMKQEMVRLYQQEGISLKQASKDFEKKYGMHISSSTLSKYARAQLTDQGIVISNRKEAIERNKHSKTTKETYTPPELNRVE